MAIITRGEIRGYVEKITREENIDAQINDYINTSLMEINDPAWAFEQIAGLRGYHHLWSFNRRKHTFATVASTENYQLPRDVVEIGFIRQTATPQRIRFIPDEIFYEYIPNPTATGNPKWYRMWEEEGVSTRLSTDDRVKVVSSSSSDGSSFTVKVVGYSTTGFLQSETLTLNGTTAIEGTLTYDAGREIKVSKSAATTGNITLSEYTAGTTLVVLAPEERVARFKVISLYPIPSSAITIYLEYFTRLRLLTHDTDVPDIDEKWINIICLGAQAKVYMYQNKEGLFNTTQSLYASGVRSMVKADIQRVDYIPYLRSQMDFISKVGMIEVSDDNFALNF